MAPLLTWTLPEGYIVDSLQWPIPTRFNSDGTTSFGYEKNMTLIAKIIPSKSAKGPITIGAEVRWVVCSDTTCLPGESQASLNLPLSFQEPIHNELNKDFFLKARAKIPEKYEAVTIAKKASLIEIAFINPHSEITDVDFFPETGAIDYKVKTLLQKNKEDSSSYTILLKQGSIESQLKGVLVVHPLEGTSKAYEIDAPIPMQSNENIASLNLSKGKVEFVQSHLNTLPSEAFSFQGGLPLAIAFAFLGGMLLNLMPCVLPCYFFQSLKLCQNGQAKSQTHFSAWPSFFLRSIIVILDLSDNALDFASLWKIGWLGIQLQEPLFVQHLLLSFLSLD